MATRAYTGVGGKARKVRRIYIGVNGKARSVKKVYVGVNGKARCCWRRPGLYKYSGSLSPLTKAVNHLAATSVSHFALFAGGTYSILNNDFSNDVTVYGNNLTQVGGVNDLIYSVSYNAGTSVADHALFSGGSLKNIIVSGMKYSNITEAYDSNLTHTRIEGLDGGLKGLAATTVGGNTGYALFGGGIGNYKGSDNMNAYNPSLTKTNIKNLSNKELEGIAATSVGQYALFAGGGCRDEVYAYNSNLVQTNAAVLRYCTQYMAAASISSKYALFGGGENSSMNAVYSAVDVYNSQLTKMPLLDLPYASTGLTACGIGEYALFAGGGGIRAEDERNSVTVYDALLTRESMSMHVGRFAAAATSNGEYAIIAGGMNVGTETPDVYYEI